MMRLTDNTVEKSTPSTLDDFLALQCVAGRELSEIVSDRGNSILIYPHSFRECRDGIGEQEIFRLKLNWKRARCESADLQTGNLVGFIGINDRQISIRSRFADKDEDDCFFHYLLHRVFNLNLFNLPHSATEQSVFDFMLYLFPRFLNDAMRQGIYKEYRTDERNDANVRGTLDLNRHLRSNIPFNGRIAYRTREFSHDNRVTRLIRHTIDYIRTQKGGGFLLENDPETRASVAKIINSTAAVERTDRSKIISDNIRAVTHPYFTAYRPLQELCLRILRHERIKYGSGGHEIYGMLFDVSYMWEEYLGSLLLPLGFRHPDNRRMIGSIFLGDGRKYPRYPDFYDHDSHGTVIDAKYKRTINSRDDVNQMTTYMYRLMARNGIFVQPDSSVTPPECHPLKGHGLDAGACLRTYRFHIPQHQSGFTDFAIRMRESEASFREYIRRIR